MLDNLEQIISAAPEIASLLEQTPQLRVLVTSRTPLGVAAERLVEVNPLAVPRARERDPELLANAPSVQLFVQRASARSPGFAVNPENASVIAQIVRYLDGLPLAIELAAAQVRFYSPTAILTEMDERFAFLNKGDPSSLPHQQALETTIAWSHDLLAKRERQLLARLSVFTGGWTGEAARAVTAQSVDDARQIDLGLRALAEASLIRREADEAQSGRWSMLETIRAFAADRLSGMGEEADLSKRHAEWCLGLAMSALPGLGGPEQAIWLNRLAVEHENLRAALAWGESRQGWNGRLQLPAALWEFWKVGGHLSEGRRWLQQALGPGHDDGDAQDRLEAITGAGVLAMDQGDYEVAQAWLNEGLVLARAESDRGREAAFLNNLGAVALSRGVLGEAETLFSESLALSEAIGDLGRRADALANLGALEHFAGDVVAATRRYSEALRLWRESGDTRGVVDMLLNLVLLLAPIQSRKSERARWQTSHSAAAELLVTVSARDSR